MIPTRLSRHLTGPIARGSIGTLALLVAGTALGFVTNVVLARVLGPAGFGAYAFGIGWLGLLAIPATLGLESLLIREVAQYRAKGEWGAARGLIAFADRVGLAASIALAVIAAAVLLHGEFDLEPELRAAAVVGAATLPALTVSRLRQGALRGLRRVVAGQAPDMLVQPALALLLIAVAYALAETELTGPFAVLLYGAAAYAGCLLAVGLLRRLRPSPLARAQPERHYRAWLRATLPFVLIAGTMAINSQIDVVMLGFMLGAEPTGIYRVASRIADIAGFPLLAVMVALGPIIAGLFAEGRFQEMQERLTKAARATLAMTLVMALALASLDGSILLLFGEAFQAGQTVLVILLVGRIVEAALGPAGVLLSMTKYANLAAVGIGVGAVTNIIFNLVLIPRFGIEGAAIATAASILIRSGTMVMLARATLAIHSTALGRSTIR